MAGMVVQHNMNALNAYNRLNYNVSGLKKASEKLSSGYRINRAGDDAAGLAISEKMRSQIRGLNQAKRNSQDGISMIQTFEGALQESHSILQRMKELASEAANGTYQDEVDRDAIQLEFDQLNDELNQIADTDFNGVVMLNGGEMADGTKAVNGKFEYVANAPRTEAMAWGANDINTVDSKDYNGDAVSADSLWDNLGLGEDVKSVDLTFTYDEATDTWSITDASDMTALKNKAGVAITRGGADQDVDYTGVNATNNNGGFSLVSTATNNNGNNHLGADTPKKYSANSAAGVEYANVVLDSSKLVDGDTVTLTFTRPVSTNTAPENIAVTDDSLEVKLGTGVADSSFTDPVLTVNKSGADNQYETTNKTITGAKEMTDAVAKAFNGLDDLKIDVSWKTNDGGDGLEQDAIKLTFADGTTKSLTLGGDTNITLQDGTGYTITEATGALTITDVNGVEIATITTTDHTNTTVTGGTAGEKTTQSFSINLDTAIYSADAEPKVSVKGGEADGAVSKSNSNNAATAPLTYADHLVLQTGARTKDSVDFTFSYDTDGMGDLKANLNVSSRTDGLGTADLSLSTQEDANAAIDKIDNAINKVSMVRATFGATQNRLEHKIENITATTENLTEAESTIRDTDMASEMMNYTKFNILQQAAQSMLAQANQQPQSILQLLG